jgi:membrane protease YdiL (CAAX protease family)
VPIFLAKGAPVCHTPGIGPPTEPSVTPSRGPFKPFGARPHNRAGPERRIVSNEVQQPTTVFTATHAVTLVGIALFAAWLARTSLGRRALVGSKPRRNRMVPLTLLIPFVIWFLGPVLLQPLSEAVAGPAQGSRLAFLNSIDYCIGSLAAVAAAMLLVRVDFARGLRGWGLRLRTVPRDFALAFVRLLAVWPLVMAMIIVVMAVGKVLRGPTYEISPHEELKLITTTPWWSLQVLVVILAVVVAPLVEEVLFRGLLQTVIRSYLRRPWLSIFVTSVLFASIHQNPEHWPALFMLALGLGYAYEKSGSLWQPIFMHALFNGLTIASALSETMRV